MDTQSSPTTDAAAIRAAIHASAGNGIPPVLVTVEQTGGGTATLYVGRPGRADIFDADGRAWLSIGPGSYDYRNPWASTFYFDDLSIGADDDGETPSTYADTLADVTRAIAERLATR